MTDATEAPDIPNDAELPTVQEAWSRVMTDVQYMRKDRRPDSGPRFAYRGVDDVLNAFGPILRKHRVIVLPLGGTVQSRDVTVGNPPKPARDVILEARYLIIGPRGDTLEGGMPGEAIDVGDKAVPKAGSVAFREFMLKAACLSVEGYEGATPDPDAQSYERADGEDPEAENLRWVAKQVDAVLDMADLDRLAIGERKLAADSRADRNVSGLLKPQDRERLHIEPTDPVTLLALVGFARVYVKDNGHAVRAPAPADAEQPA